MSRTISRAKPYPMPIEQMIDRDGIKEITGCTNNEVIFCTKHRPKGFPLACHRGANRCVFYSRDEVIEWLCKNNIREIYNNSEEKLKKREQRQAERDEKNYRPPSEVFDNSLAVSFLSSGATMARLVAKFVHSERKTVVVHLEDLNEYTPPHSGLMLYSSGMDHQFIGSNL